MNDGAAHLVEGQPFAGGTAQAELVGTLAVVVRQAAEAMQPETVAVDAATAGRMFGVAPATWRRMYSGELVPPPIRVGRSLRWLTAELVAWAEAGAPPRASWRKIRPGRAPRAR